jgi:hypothetical protein
MRETPEGQGTGGPRGSTARLALPRRADAEGATGAGCPPGWDLRLVPIAWGASTALRPRARPGGGGVGRVHELRGEEAGVALEEGGEVPKVSRRTYLRGRPASMLQILARESKHWRSALQSSDASL